MTIAVGKANYSSNTGNTFEKTIFFRLGHKKPEDRTLIVRIAPPVGPLAEKGIWSRFVKQHFGYTISFVGKDAQKRSIPATFLCIEKKDREGNITQHCPECDEITAQKAKVDAKVKQLEKEGKTEEEIDTAVRFLKSWLKDHNLDKKWNMVAKNLSSQWGFLTISHSCYKLLKGNAQAPGLIDALVDKNIDPLGVEGGVWFRFTRRGGPAWNEIKDIPEVEQVEEEVQVGGKTKMMKSDKTDTLTESDLEQIAKLPSLMDLGRTLTFDQIKMLVESGNDEEIVRAVMNLPRENRPANKPAETKAASDESDEPAEESAPATPPAAPSSAAPVEEDEVTKLKRQLAEAEAKAKTAAKPAAAPKAGTGKQPPANIKAEMESMNMDEFLSKYENKA